MRHTLSTLAVTALLFGCGGAAPAVDPPSGPPTVPTIDAPAEIPDLPATKAVEQSQGGEYWAVYLAVDADQKSPAMQAAVAALHGQGLVLGKTFGLGALDCDVGAADALKRPGEHVAAAAYFASEADARSFAKEQATPALGVVRIKAMCRD
jgi:hypothetical protein